MSCALCDFSHDLSIALWGFFANQSFGCGGDNNAISWVLPLVKSLKF